MPIMLARGSNRSRERSMAAINEVDLYAQAASTLTGTSAYWREVVQRVERIAEQRAVHSSFYRVEHVQEDERPIETVSFVEAPPDDTDW